MNNLVQIKDNQLITDSLIIAEKFNKQHSHVLRAIELLECSKEFNESNFGLISYTDSMNRSKKKYEITRDGFFFLAMSFTGKTAASFKEKFIQAFNKMENVLIQQNHPNYLEKYAELQSQLVYIKDEMNCLEYRIETNYNIKFSKSANKIIENRSHLKSLLKADIYKAWEEEKPFTRTGRKQGLYRRRKELSKGLQNICRDKIQAMAKELIDEGWVGRDEDGYLSVC